MNSVNTQFKFLQNDNGDDVVQYPRTDSMLDVDLVKRAFEFAKEGHSGQFRKNPGRTPAITHPVKVFRLLYELGGVRVSEVLAAALLHDTIEDTSITVSDLSQNFGPVVSSVVAEVSDDKASPKIQRKHLQILRACNLSDSATLVRIADKIANVDDIVSNPPEGWNRERRLEYLLWADAVVSNLKCNNQFLLEYFKVIVARGMDYVSEIDDQMPSPWKTRKGEQEMGLDFDCF